MQNETFPPHDTPETAPTETETAKQKFEQERLTRRQALKKFGMTSAMATFALFSVDDLARMVGGAMERQARNSKIAAQVAEEFQHSGIALGATQYTPYGYGCWMYGCQNPGDCKPAHSWEICPPCSTPGCVSKNTVFNCSKSAGLAACLQCCDDTFTSCQQQAPTYNCNTLLSGCRTNCGS